MPLRHTTLPPCRWPWRGLTLIELMIAVAVLGLLVSLAAPVYEQQMRRVRRTDAHAALGRVQLAQEHWRAQHTGYSSVLGSGGLGLGDVSAARHYRISLRVTPETVANQTLAVAEAVGPQAADLDCRYLALGVQAGAWVESSGADARLANPATTNRRCWGR